MAIGANGGASGSHLRSKSDPTKNPRRRDLRKSATSSRAHTKSLWNRGRQIDPVLDCSTRPRIFLLSGVMSTPPPLLFEYWNDTTPGCAQLRPSTTAATCPVFEAATPTSYGPWTPRPTEPGLTTIPLSPSAIPWVGCPISSLSSRPGADRRHLFLPEGLQSGRHDLPVILRCVDLIKVSFRDSQTEETLLRLGRRSLRDDDRCRERAN